MITLSLSCLEEAELAFKRKDYPICVRRSQESLEMVAKALLRALAIEYPKAHDVSPALISASSKLPDAIRCRVEHLSSLISELAAVRGIAMYGYEREGIPASKAISEGYAKGVLEEVRGYVGMISEVLIPILKENGFWED
ncbi:MAG: HEPN domain-containing protein [Candidatus Korarchaeum sp.]